MAKISLRTASIYCLAIWAAVWCLFMLIRFSAFDIRVIPGIGPIMLVALGIAVVGPIVAIAIAGLALILRPRAPLSWLILGSAVAASFAVGFIFLATKWL
jgi:glucan phosphoethanolaminetransferase (alkaline phosphatase superfamily)